MNTKLEKQIKIFEDDNVFITDIQAPSNDAVFVSTGYYTSKNVVPQSRLFCVELEYVAIMEITIPIEAAGRHFVKVSEKPFRFATVNNSYYSNATKGFTGHIKISDTSKIVNEIRLDHSVANFAFTPKGKYVVSLEEKQEENIVHITEAETGVEIRQIDNLPKKQHEGNQSDSIMILPDLSIAIFNPGRLGGTLTMIGRVDED